jgi:Domain of unknown function (DUF4349)
MKVVTLGAAVLLLLACKGDKEQSQARDGFAAVTEQSASAPVMNAPSPAPSPEMMSKASAGIGSGDVRERRMSMSDQSVAQEPAVPNSTQAIAAGTTEQVAPSMLIRTGGASIEVDKLDPAIVKVKQLAATLGGYVANSSISGGRDQVRSATLELKIPAARYDQAVGGLGGIGKVEAVNTNVEDVGEEYVDITARVTNAKRLEERLVTLLATRTGKLEDVLAVERELARVREEIERYEGRMRFLRTRAAVSTLSVTVHEPLPLLGQNPGDNPIAAAVKAAWRNFVAFISWMIASLGVLIPVGALLALVWWFVRRRKTQP